jgi:Flp pilus assembly protein CpaB
MDAAVARKVTPARWVNLRTLLGVLLFVVSFLAGQRVLADARSTTGAWVATADLPSGAVIGPGDAELRQVRLGGDLAAAYLGSGADPVGMVVTRPVRAGELLATAWTLPSAAGVDAGRAITVPVEPQHAVGGELRPGDRVDVIATFDAGTLEARSAVLARSVEVLGLVSAEGLGFGDDSVIGVTLSVSPDEAARLAFALRSGDIDIAKVLGADDGSASLSTVTRTDLP